jgi:hypothetical protein
MIRNLLYLSDGTCISSGADQTNAIQSCTVTECVNSGKELTIGSACCACLEMKIFAPGGELNIPTGKAVTLCKEVDGGEPMQVGAFLPERPVKANANVYKLTAYDNVSKLDKDISSWLKGLKWPAAGYPLLSFAGMVCTACGLKLATTSIPNATMPVYQFYKAGVTGRQIMKWIGECAGRFCRANARGEIELAWYNSSGVTVRATGGRYYFAGKLSYEDYNVATIDAVKLRLADSEDGALWPSGAADNPYIITGNPILLAKVTDELKPYLTTIRSQLTALPAYRPCKVSLPASMDIRAGQTVRIVDKNGVEFTTCVMTKTQTGQGDTLECTGSARRDSATTANNKTAAQVAQQAVDAQTQMEIFNKLTNGGEVQGLFYKDGKLYLNATYAVTGILQSKDQKTFYLDLDNGVLKMEATELSISGKSVDKIAQEKVDAQTQDDVFNKLTNNGAIQGINVKNGKWYINAETIATGILRSADGRSYFDLVNSVFRSESDTSITEISGGVAKVYNKAGKLIFSLGAHTNDSGNLQLYGEDGQTALEFYAMGNRVAMTCWDADAKAMVGGPVAFREINGVRALALSL